MDYDLVEFISMQAQFLCLSASLPRACNFQAFPHSLRSVVPYGLAHIFILAQFN